MDIGAGRLGIPTVNVARVEEGHSPLQEFEDRAARIPAGDGQAWLALGDWADAQGLGTQAREAYNRALSASPDNARANEAVGNVYVGGRWVGGDEAYRARGYIKFEGQWMTPAEHEAILRERAAENAMEPSGGRAKCAPARRKPGRTKQRRGRGRRKRRRRRPRRRGTAFPSGTAGARDPPSGRRGRSSCRRSAPGGW